MSRVKSVTTAMKSAIATREPIMRMSAKSTEMMRTRTRATKRRVCAADVREPREDGPIALRIILPTAMAKLCYEQNPKSEKGQKPKTQTFLVNLTF